ncbi:hypothetical protein N3K66_008847 [Trichothecium roseum]|uniref:Uncharacterized protein n=1 Tax=Trichothecium roseum TaxID=47278 RepID=A0ACC0URD4_9HYPO|nr:hypothetical protein N3K66_008847 [Trichothecium roseum]
MAAPSHHSTTSDQNADITGPEPAADLTTNAKSSDDEKSLAADISPENADSVSAERGAGDETESSVASSEDSGGQDGEERSTALYKWLHDLLCLINDGEAISDDDKEKQINDILQWDGGKDRVDDSTYCDDHLTELDVAVGLNSYVAAEFLLKNWKDVLGKTSPPKRLLFHAVFSVENEDLVRLLVQHGADINAKDNNGRTALDHACLGGNEDMVGVLLDLHADTQVVDAGKWSPLHSAASWGNSGIAEMLLKKDKANINHRKASGETALDLAIRMRHEKFVQVLLHAGADCNAVTGDEGTTPLMKAVNQPETGIAEALLSAGQPAEIDKRGPQQRTALHIAANHGMSNMVPLLLEKGADALAADSDGCIPLHLASAEGHVDVLNCLLSNLGKEQIERTDNDGHTAIMKACQAGSRAVMETLLKNFDGTYFGGKELAEKDALRWASQNQDRHDLAALLLSKGPQPEEDLNEKDQAWSAIEWAAYRKNAPVLWLLLAWSSHDDETERRRKSALEIAERLAPAQAKNLVPAKSQERSSQAAKEHSHEKSTGRDTKANEPDVPKEVNVIIDILRDPPSMYYQDIKELCLPSDGGVNLEDFKNLEVAIVLFSSEEDGFVTSKRFRSPKEAIYTLGPSKIIQDIEQLMKDINGMSQPLDSGGDNKEPEQAAGGSMETNFIWVHLPATNMKWMNHFDHDQASPDDETENDSTTNEKTDEEDKQSGREATENEALAKLRNSRRKYDKLIGAYTDIKQVIHGSPTLDESYYHFETEETLVQERRKRNKSQVVTKRLMKNDNFVEDTARVWPLVGVNQIWAWTIGKKWLLTASSYPVDGSKEGLLQDILEELRSQGDYGGSQSLPKTAPDMSDYIVEYCVASYERKRKAEKTDDRSIRQLFSHSINLIGIDELTLLSKNQRQGKDVPVISGQGAKDAIKHAESLSYRIKDIRDELSILRAVAGYQKNVQDRIFRARGKKSNSLATYVFNDIGQMDNVSMRVEAAVDMTLSLQQNEMAFSQNKTLMIFSVVTILFSPLSFLSSLFALDVASFSKAPAWSFVVIFGVSFIFFAPLAYYAAAPEKFMLMIAKLPTGMPLVKKLKEIWAAKCGNQRGKQAPPAPGAGEPGVNSSADDANARDIGWKRMLARMNNALCRPSNAQGHKPDLEEGRSNSTGENDNTARRRWNSPSKGNSVARHRRQSPTNVQG